MDAELNKVDDVAKATSAAAQEKKSSTPGISHTVETAGLYLLLLRLTFFFMKLVKSASR